MLRRTKVEIECKSFRNHTPAPEGFIQWVDWAEKMSKTHRQIKCPDCGRWTIWIPKTPEHAALTAGK